MIRRNNGNNETLIVMLPVKEVLQIFIRYLQRDLIKEEIFVLEAETVVLLFR